MEKVAQYVVGAVLGLVSALMAIFMGRKVSHAEPPPPASPEAQVQTARRQEEALEQERRQAVLQTQVHDINAARAAETARIQKLSDADVAKELADLDSGGKPAVSGPDKPR